jgi:hypothetical protein
VILRKVFKRIYGKDVVLSVLCVPSFVPEEAAGILKTSQGYEAFALTPSSSTWSTEYHRFIKEADAHGKEIPFDPPRKQRRVSLRATTELRRAFSHDLYLLILQTG